MTPKLAYRLKAGLSFSSLLKSRLLRVVSITVLLVMVFMMIFRLNYLESPGISRSYAITLIIKMQDQGY
ncbi:putative membrane protein [Anaplasma phagocytophilum str. NCH-1]|uniref:Putative membrane protein n=1 Tax=Anaplasma phagocytophilum str. NCH-1 TaxID=1359161 RepID=A0A0F3NKK3_ANAPH|nr:hypothetical protein YYU_00715 [Anaplasma phagocytophilum str. HZ2]AGR80457.1 hypothetical protein WSQ_00705 [Anaplasma phagocytophilum str. JM]KJV59515.1 putative membrane protein [Anaplasma phagocytophilum str. Webster]KJV68306.1 putative membrane protein [Anaplasma phagocytophilum str. NCH-1]KJV88381.1 putative membrane protein [Anaplasma phagocytophilum str. ApNYW]